MILKFQDITLSQVERDALSKHYYHIINLNVLALKTRGNILEKFRRFDEAIESYSMAKQVVETNYGHSDKMYIELANAINGAKLRTKYFQNSNLPAGGQRSAIQYENAKRPPIPAYPLNKPGVHLMRELERMKPIG